MKKSKTQHLLEYLEAGNRVSGIEALQKFGIYRLGSVVHKLRQRGYEITTTNTRFVDGEFAVYHLVKADNG